MVLVIQIILGLLEVEVEQQQQVLTGIHLDQVQEAQVLQLKFQDLQQLMLVVEVEVVLIMELLLVELVELVVEEMVNQEVRLHLVKTELLIEVVEQVVGLNGVANNQVIMEEVV